MHYLAVNSYICVNKTINNEEITSFSAWFSIKSICGYGINNGTITANRFILNGFGYGYGYKNKKF